MSPSTPQAQQAQPTSWRDVLPVHPAANKIPELSEDERRGLAADLSKHGVEVPVVLVRVAGGPPQLLDGRHRLDLFESPGTFFKRGVPVKRRVVDDDGRVLVKHEIVDVADDAEAELRSRSLNLHRRQLPEEERHKLLRAQLIATPEKSNRQVAKLTGFSHPHVAKVRAELEQAGDVETVSTSIDTKGRKQPAKKPSKPKPPPDPAVVINHRIRTVKLQIEAMLDAKPGDEEHERLVFQRVQDCLAEIKAEMEADREAEREDEHGADPFAIPDFLDRRAAP